MSHLNYQKTKVSIVLGATIALLVASSLVAAGPDKRNQAQRAQSPVGGNPEQTCQGDQKIEGRFNHSYFPGDGLQITEVCIKAGQNKPTFACGETDASGCYTLTWGDNCESVTIAGGGTSRDCQDISHTTATFGDAPPPTYGRITILKATEFPNQPAPVGGFAFTVSDSDGEVASGSIGVGGELVVDTLPLGNYSIAELSLAGTGWTFVSISCDEGNNPQVGGSSVTVTLSESDNEVTCTFTNNPVPS